MKIKIMGTRGSVPTTATESGESVKDFGGDTSCYVFENGASDVVVDAGSGIRYYNNPEKEALILFSHMHDDHTIGLGFFKRMYFPTNKLVLCASSEHIDSLKVHYSLMARMFPVQLGGFKGIKGVSRFDKETEFFGFRIKTFLLNHPQNSYGFIFEDLITAARVGMVNDHEHDRDLTRFGESDLRIISQLKGCKTILIEGQYTPEEYDPAQLGKNGFSRVGWGHSVDIKAAKIALETGAERVYLIHHDPNHSDSFLMKREEVVRESTGKDNIYFARQGLEILLD